jgi:hypothetical protein
MFTEMFDCLDNGTQPQEDFYDGYVVNAVMDACYKSARTKQWEPVQLDIWRGQSGVPKISALKDYDPDHYLIKEELLPDGSRKLILKEKATGRIFEK